MLTLTTKAFLPIRIAASRSLRASLITVFSAGAAGSILCVVKWEVPAAAGRGGGPGGGGAAWPPDAGGGGGAYPLAPATIVPGGSGPPGGEAKAV